MARRRSSRGEPRRRRGRGATTRCSRGWRSRTSAQTKPDDSGRDEAAWRHVIRVPAARSQGTRHRRRRGAPRRGTGRYVRDTSLFRPRRGSPENNRAREVTLKQVTANTAHGGTSAARMQLCLSAARSPQQSRRARIPEAVRGWRHRRTSTGTDTSARGQPVSHHRSRAAKNPLAARRRATIGVEERAQPRLVELVDVERQAAP